MASTNSLSSLEGFVSSGSMSHVRSAHHRRRACGAVGGHDRVTAEPVRERRSGIRAGGVKALRTIPQRPIRPALLRPWQQAHATACIVAVDKATMGKTFGVCGRICRGQGAPACDRYCPARHVSAGGRRRRNMRRRDGMLYRGKGAGSKRHERTSGGDRLPAGDRL